MAGYIGSSAAVSTPGTERKKTFAITTTTTSLTGLVYTVNFVHVYHNGIRLVDGTDFTATNSTSITLVNAAENGDEVVVVSYATFSPADSVPSTGGTFSGDVNFGANATFGDNDKAIFGAGSDLEIYHDGTHSYINDVGTGPLRITSDGTGILLNKSTTESMGRFLTDGAVELYYDSAKKFETTSTGCDITGVLTSDGLLVQSTSGSTTGTIRSDAGSNSVLYLDTQDTSSASYITASGFLAIATGSGTPERLRVDSSGNLLLGTTSPISGANAKLLVQIADMGAAFKAANNGNWALGFYNSSGTNVGQIIINASSTSYNTSSDYRLKTDAQPMTGASARVQALNPVNFEWIADGSRVDGFLAHEAQAVVPEAVHGTKDAMKDEEYEVTPAVLDDDGNETTAAVMGTRSVPDMQSIDQSKLVPLLTAALQEALTKIDDMETRLAALEVTP